MASKEKKELEILLNRIELHGVPSVKSGKHLVTLELICPRPLVASKSAARTYKFEKGVVDCSNMQWVKRIFFKESVEYRFGISMKISESVTDAYIADFFRYFAGTVFGIGGNVVENAVGGFPGDVAAVPFDYAKKRIVSSSSTVTPKIVLDGAVDLLPSDIGDNLEIKIPLCTLKGTYSTESIGHGGRDDTRRITRKLIASAGTEVGFASLQLNAL